jgi:hypothetical protein
VGRLVDIREDAETQRTNDVDATTYSRVAELPLRVDRCELLPLVRDTTSGFTKVSTVVRLTGDGQEGQGEDITWDQIDQIEQLRRAGDLSWLRGRRTFDEFSALLGLADLFPVDPIRERARDYRRWAFESAALDLALRQSGLSLGAAVGREARPVTFVRSGQPEPEWRRLYPELRYKLDVADSWDEAFVAELRESGLVDVVDLKGLYEGDWVRATPSARLYRLVAQGLPDAWLEDPRLNDETGPVLEPHRDRITWDAAIHSAQDIDALPFPPRCLNSKPSRFGTVRSLFDFYDLCEARRIRIYGGGQFELGPGRSQVQHLAALFHPDSPNDVAPTEYNFAPAAGLPRSPLPPPSGNPGFR